MKLRVVIAHPDRAVLEELGNEVRGTGDDIESLSLVDSAGELFQTARRDRADAILYSLDLPGLIELDVIHQIKRYKKMCYFEALTEGEATREELLMCIRLKADHTSSLPLTREKLGEILRCAVRENGVKRRDTLFHSHCRQGKQVLMESLNRIDPAMPLARINEKLFTNFHPGLFRVLLIRQDIHRDSMDYFFDDFSMREEAVYISKEYLNDLYNDYAVQYVRNGLLMLINYPREKDAEIDRAIRLMFVALHGKMQREQNVQVSVCVGKAYENFSDIVRSREEAREADWQHLNGKPGSLVFYEELRSLEAEYAEQLEKLRERAEKALTTLDGPEFDRCVNAVCCLPIEVRRHGAVKIWADRLVSYFIALNGKRMDEATYGKQEADTLMTRMIYSDTADEYLRRFREGVRNMMEKIRAMTEGRSVHSIRVVERYLSEHYAEALGVTDVAEMVHLSVTYFSTLFRKETGKNFLQYLQDLRMEKAKEMLRGTDQPVYQVALKVGFTDQRYFSKIFRKEVGTTPSEYRKMNL